MSFWPFDPFASQLISGTGLVGCYTDRRGYINFALAINLCCVNVWSEYVRRMIQPFAFTNNVITSLGTPDLRALYLFYYLRVLFYGLPSQYQSSLACRKWCLFGYFWLSQTSLVSKLVSRRSKPVSNDSNMFLFIFNSWPGRLSRPCRRRGRRVLQNVPDHLARAWLGSCRCWLQSTLQIWITQLDRRIRHIFGIFLSSWLLMQEENVLAA